jgi:hypothetical protein
MDMKDTVSISANRGKTIYKSTGIDTSELPQGKDVAQLKGSDIGGSRDSLSHSITSGSVAKGK